METVIGLIAITILWNAFRRFQSAAACGGFLECGNCWECTPETDRTLQADGSLKIFK